MKVLFLVPYPTEGASNRVRVEQFLPYLRDKGVSCRVRPFINKRFYAIIYSPHHYAEKVFWFLVCTLNRILDIVRALKYDIVFIHREAYPFGAPVIESILYGMGKNLVFDFDDAIFLPNTSRENIYINRLKNPGKVPKIIQMSKCVMAGNEYLKNYALKYAKNVIVIPSSIDTDKYKPLPRPGGRKDVTIGWIGSGTTMGFLLDIETVFKKLSARYGNIVFKLVGAESAGMVFDNVERKSWRLEDEVDDLRSFDIGIMPVPDNEWTKGKCGFKAILYMACGIPVVASPVGVNRTIIEDGIDGFLADTPAEWTRKLSILVEDENLRRAMGQRGREKVTKKYSVSFTAPLFYESLMKISSPGKIS